MSTLESTPTECPRANNDGCLLHPVHLPPQVVAALLPASCTVFLHLVRRRPLFYCIQCAVHCLVRGTPRSA